MVYKNQQRCCTTVRDETHRHRHAPDGPNGSCQAFKRNNPLLDPPIAQHTPARIRDRFHGGEKPQRAFSSVNIPSRTVLAPQEVGANRDGPGSCPGFRAFLAARSGRRATGRSSLLPASDSSYPSSPSRSQVDRSRPRITKPRSSAEVRNDVLLT